METVALLYLQSVIKRFQEYKALGDATIAQLTVGQLHIAPNEWSNSIAVIVQHLHGNMQSRWTNFLTEDGEKPSRRRDAEFELQHHSKEQILRLWNDGWTTLFKTLDALQDNDLKKTITIRSEPLVAIDAINRQLLHYGGHIGQIVYIGKWLSGNAWQTVSIPKGASQHFNEQMRRNKS